MLDIKNFIKTKAKEIDAHLVDFMPNEATNPELIHQAMLYSLNAGGKRIRPLLCILAAEAVGGKKEQVLPVACALEMIHTYSLIHDDLPAMDNDDYRRGKLTNHMVFGEAIAILAGDGLLTHAFAVMTDSKAEPARILQVIQEIANAAGSLGMIGGQVADIESENLHVDYATLEFIHTHKTGALFRASLRAGGILAGASEQQLSALTEFAEQLGLAFQITDDILDVIGDEEKLGKPIGSDEKNQKSTYPSIFGLDKSKKMAQEAVDKAVCSLGVFGKEAEPLRALAKYLLVREN